MSHVLSHRLTESLKRVQQANMIAQDLDKTVQFFPKMYKNRFTQNVCPVARCLPSRPHPRKGFSCVAQRSALHAGCVGGLQTMVYVVSWLLQLSASLCDVLAVLRTVRLRFSGWHERRCCVSFKVPSRGWKGCKSTR